MKRQLTKLSLLCLIFLFISADKAAEKILISQVNYLNGIYKYNDRPVTGEIIDYYENEILKFTYRALEGRLHGNATEYFPNGQIKSVRNYTYNKLFGEFTEYFENGDTKLQFIVGLNAYDQGELLSDIQIAKEGNRKLKDFGEGILIFADENNDSNGTSEEISILSQSHFKIVNEKGKILFQH